jgi:DNA polymerase
MQKLYLDFETYYDTKLSLSKITTVEYVHNPAFKVWGVGVKLEDGETEWISGEDCDDFFAQIDWDQVALVCHNTLFDAYILTQYYGYYPAYYYDTAAMARGFAPNESASLKEVAKRCFPTDETMRKGDELVQAKGIVDLPPDVEDAIAGYCIQDVDLTYHIFQRYIQTYPQQELDLIDLTVRMFVEPKLMLDTDLLEKHREKIATQTEQLIHNSGLSREVLASQKKFAEHLTQDLGLVIPKKKSPATGEMIPAFSKGDVAYLQFCRAHPEYKHIWDAREAVKSRIEETRAERMISATNPDGTFSVPLRYYAAHTGRFGGFDKINLQNLPRGSQLRTALQSPPGNYLYIADLSNIEARMLAWLAKEADLLDAFAQGRDVYSEFASDIYGRPITKANKLERYVGKTAILGLGYGMGADKFKLTLKSGSPSVDITDQTAISIVNQYRGKYPNINRLWHVCKQLLFNMIDRGSQNAAYGPLVIQNKALQLPNGMSLQYPNLHYSAGQFLYNSGKTVIRTYGPRLTENIVQALARIVITEQMLEIQKLPGVSIVMQIHDEIVSVSSDVAPDETMEQILSIMKTPPSWCSELPLDAEGGYSNRYDK